MNTFEKYQAAARQTAQYPVIGHGIVYPALGLAGEAGEVADKVKKLFRDHNGELDRCRADLIMELGDVLWYLSALCDQLHVDLAEVAVMNIAKLQSRADRGTLGGEGDDR